MRSPCKDCSERELLCHSKCPRYSEFYQWNEKRKHEKALDRLGEWNEGIFKKSEEKLKRQKQGYYSRGSYNER